MVNVVYLFRQILAHYNDGVQMEKFRSEVLGNFSFFFTVLFLTNEPQLSGNGEVADGDIDGFVDFLDVGDFLFEAGGPFELADGNGVNLHDFADGEL